MSESANVQYIVCSLSVWICGLGFFAYHFLTSINCLHAG